MTDETTAERVIRLMGGRLRTQEITGYPKGRIDGFLKTGNIHPKWQAEMLGLAMGAGCPVNALDFVPHLLSVKPLVRDNTSAAA